MGMEIPVSDISMTSPEEQKETLTATIPEKETITTPINEPIIANIPEKEISKNESGEQKDANLAQKNATDKWAEPKIHDFYFPKFRPLDDPKIRAKMDQLNKTMNNNKELKGKIFKDLSVKNKERSEIVEQLAPLREKLKQINNVFNQKRTEMAPLKEGLQKIRSDNIAIKEKGHGLCSSVEELDDLLKSLEYRMNHESMPLNEEKQLMKEIKNLEGTRARVIANAAERSKLDFNKKDTLEGQKKLIAADMDEMKKERDAIWAKIEALDKQKAPIDEAIKALEEQKNALTDRNNKAYNSLRELYAERDALNRCFTENRQFLIHAKTLAAQKDVTALETLVESEVEKFFTEWNTNKSFHSDYTTRILPSLDARQFTIDGRMRNPNDKPILQPQPPTPAPSVPTPDPTPITMKPAPAPTPASTKPTKKAVKPVVEEEEDEGYFVSEKKIEGEKEKKVDAEKLKEMKREEEIQKNKMALERKKKLAEKNAAKAAAKAQKEAEEKLKKKEAKKAKKKGGAFAELSDEPTETEPKSDDLIEPESESKDETDSVVPPAQTKSRNTSIKSRNVGKRGLSNNNNQLPKVILKRKKTDKSFLGWAPLPVILAVLSAALIGVFGALYVKFYMEA